jgi:hypothetical protein
LGYDDVLSDLWGDSSDEGSPSVVQWNAMGLARYFDRGLRSAPWNNGFSMTNMRALAAQLKKWKTDGKTEEEVRALIDFYMTDVTARGFNPGWKDFLYRAEANSAKLTPKEVETAKESVKESSPLDKAREEGTYEAFLKVLRSPKIAQKYYDKYKEEHG